MKKIIILLAVALIGASSISAQTTVQGQKVHKAPTTFGAVGAHIGYAHWGTTLGLHGDFNANNFRGRAGFDLFFHPYDNSFHTYLGADVGFHYLINLIDGLNIYPIIGVGTGFGRYVDFHLGIDFGAGIEYNFSNGWGVFVDGKYNLRLIGDDVPYRSYIGVTKRF
jgi:opacity protein-like surface antigen